MSQPVTIDTSLKWQKRALRSRYTTRIQGEDLLLRQSIAAYDQRRREAWEIEILASFPPVSRAIERIVSGVLNMRWAILPPIDQADDPIAHETARWIGESLKNPNPTGNGIEGLISATVRDLLCYLAAAIERQPGDEFQAFWAWPTPPTRLEVFSGWQPDSDEPRYQFHQAAGGAIDLYDDQLFLIRKSNNSDDSQPRSPVEIAAPAILSWVSLLDYQARQTRKGSPSTLIHLGDISADELDTFRNYWQYEVEANGQQPSMGGKGTPQILRLNPQTDDGLYLGYAEYLLKMIAIAFNLTPRDLGLTDHDNRATAGEAATSTFADAILPMARLVYRKLESELVQYYFPGYRLELTDTEPRTEAEEAKRAVLLWEKGVITLNQTLVAVGYEPIGPEGDYRFGEISNGSRLLDTALSGAPVSGNPIAARSRGMARTGDRFGRIPTARLRSAAR